MTLKSSEVIFQALEPLQPQWPLQPQQPQWPQWPQQPHFIKKFTHPDGWIIPTTKMTNTSSFLRNRLSKIQWFTDIWYPFYQRLWRPAYVIFLKTGWWNSNFQTSWTHYKSEFNESIDPSTHQSWITFHTSIWDTLYIRTKRKISWKFLAFSDNLNF